MSRRFLTVFGMNLATLGFFLVTGFSSLSVANDNWPAWRGPHGNGISDAASVPTEWNAEKNVIWKADLPSWSGGTPVIWGDRIFLTSPNKDETADQAEKTAGDDGGLTPMVAQGQGQARGRGDQGQRGRQRQGQGQRRGQRRGGGTQSGPGGNTLMLICISKKDGSELWSRELDQGNRLWRKHNNASPSPVTNGVHVWVVTGTGAIACFDMDGNPVWNEHLQEKYGQFGLNWGYASSPLLYDGKLIVEVLHGNNTDDPSYVVAFDAASGDVIWHVERETDARRESPDAYTTPAVVEHEGRTTIVISGGDYVTGHNPQTGEEIWRSAGLNPQRSPNFRVVGSPVVKDGLIYAPTRNRPMLALRPGGNGDVTDSHVAFRYEGRAADVPTPVCDGKYLYVVDDRGLVTCLDAKDGTEVYGPVRTVSGTVSSSPILVDGKIYFVNENAVTVVFEAGSEFKLVAENPLNGEYTLSSIAVSDSRLYIRTAKSLFCIGNAKPE
ncbi:MAG: PQQ-binding-like beta-propeller repeat protein [Pirellulales bacterium]|nr:PQQ-binding-like beta-propeller repeat protein [Pirellulales bacterium]